MKFRVKLRRKITLNGFFRDCDELLAQMWESKFFDNLDKIKHDAIREAKRIEAYKARRAENASKAYNVLKRLRRVQAIDLFKMTQHIEPNWFGEKHIQFAEVARLHEKRARLVWYLTGLYHYLAFDYAGHGWRPTKGLNAYSKHRKVFYSLLAQHKENIKQAKWDLKRSKVRARRRKLAESKGLEPYEILRGVGNNVPVPVPMLDPDWDG